VNPASISVIIIFSLIKLPPVGLVYRSGRRSNGRRPKVTYAHPRDRVLQRRK